MDNEIDLQKTNTRIFDMSRKNNHQYDNICNTCGANITI